MTAVEREGERVAIVGSRGYADMEEVRRFVRSLAPGTVVVSGAGKRRRERLPREKWGVDEHAEDEAELCGLEVSSHPAEWEKYGKSAGHRRNPHIVDDCTRLEAFWDGKSRGTGGTLRIAGNRGKPTTIHRAIARSTSGTPRATTPRETGT